jgi:hypothetical protein
MLKKLQNISKEIKDQLKDIKQGQTLYWILFGIMIYQLVAYFVLSIVPYAPLKIFTWSFFMLIFCVLLLLIEEAITFTQAYHLAILIVVQFLLALGINTNTIFLTVIIEILLRRLQQYIHDNLSQDSLLPLVSNDAKTANTSKDDVHPVYDLVRLFIMMTFLMQVRGGFSPMFLAHISAPWCFFNSEFPILWVGLC